MADGKIMPGFKGASVTADADAKPKLFAGFTKDVGRQGDHSLGDSPNGGSTTISSPSRKGS